MTLALRSLATLIFLVLLVALGMAAIWGTAAIFTRSSCGWMALLVAADAALLLRLAAIPAGPSRAVMAVIITLFALLLGSFIVAAMNIGLAFGTAPPESLMMIDPILALTWWRLNLSPLDGASLLLALPLSWWLGR